MMFVGVTHPLVVDWLDRLDAVGLAAGLPSSRRADLAAELRDHVAAALGDSPGDAVVREVLDRLGDPEDVVAAECEPAAPMLAAPVLAAPMGAAPVLAAPAAPPVAPSGWSALEVLAVVALVGGGFVVPVLGPLVGLALAAGSTAWSRRDKQVTAALVVAPVVVWIGLLVVVYLDDGGGGLAVLPNFGDLLLLGALALLSSLSAVVAGVRLATRVGRPGRTV